jgi:hypothetical protein
MGLFGDTIWVADSHRFAMQVFSLAGDLLRGPYPFTYPRRELISLRRDGRAIAVARFDTTSTMFPQFGLRDRSHPDTTPTVTIRLHYGDQEFTLRLPNNGEMPGVENPFVRRDYVAVEPGGAGVAVVRQPPPSATREGQVDIRMYSVEGLPRWSTPLSYRLEPVTKSAVDEWIDGMERLKRNVESGRVTASVARQAVHASYQPPEYLPGISTSGPSPWLAGSNAVHVDATGLVWVRLWSETWHVVGPDGLVATIALPDGLLVKAITESHLWGVLRDEFSVPAIVRYRLRR